MCERRSAVSVNRVVRGRKQRNNLARAAAKKLKNTTKVMCPCLTAAHKVVVVHEAGGQDTRDFKKGSGEDVAAEVNATGSHGLTSMIVPLATGREVSYSFWYVRSVNTAQLARSNSRLINPSVHLI